MHAFAGLKSFLWHVDVQVSTVHNPTVEEVFKEYTFNIRKWWKTIA